MGSITHTACTCKRRTKRRRVAPKGRPMSVQLGRSALDTHHKKLKFLVGFSFVLRAGARVARFSTTVPIMNGVLSSYSDAVCSAATVMP